MVQQNQFIRHPSKDPNEHLGRFFRMSNTVKLNGVKSLPYGLVNNWEELVEDYLRKFFPPTLTSEKKGEIITFKQKEDESFCNA